MNNCSGSRRLWDDNRQMWERRILSFPSDWSAASGYYHPLATPGPLKLEPKIKDVLDYINSKADVKAELYTGTKVEVDMSMPAPSVEQQKLDEATEGSDVDIDLEFTHDEYEILQKAASLEGVGVETYIQDIIVERFK
jgi:hypothetical protein